MKLPKKMLIELLKSSTLIFSFILLASIYSEAQSRIGVQLGAQNYNARYLIDHVYDQPTSAITRYKVGLYYEHVISSGFSIRPLLSYTENGFRLQENNDTSNRMIMNIDSKDMGLSVLAKISAKSGNMRPFFEIGPGLTYTVDRSMTSFGESPVVGLLPEEMNKVDGKIIAGVGFETYFGKMAVDFFFRYEMGVGNRYTGQESGVVVRSKAFSFGTSIGLFSFGSKNATNCVQGKCKK